MNDYLCLMLLQEVIGQNIKRVRKAKGWSQGALCKQIKTLNQARLSSIENGELSITAKSIEQFAKVLEVEPYELLINRSIKDQSVKEKLVLINKLPKSEKQSLLKIIDALLRDQGIVK